MRDLYIMEVLVPMNEMTTVDVARAPDASSDQEAGGNKEAPLRGLLIIMMDTGGSRPPVLDVVRA